MSPSFVASGLDRRSISIRALGGLLLVGSLSSGCRVFGDGMAWAKDDAPFRIGMLRSAYFLTNPNNPPSGGEGILFLSDAAVDCDDLSRFGEDEGVEEAFDGNGLLFVIEVDFDAGGFDDELDWEGLYLEGSSMGIGDEVVRTMLPYAFSDGMLFSMGSGGGYYYSSSSGSQPAWLDVRKMEDEKVSGKFDTLWWEGGFGGERCDLDQGGDGFETGYYGDSGNWRQ